MAKNTWNIMRLRAGETKRKAGGFLGLGHANEEFTVTYWIFAVWNDEHKIVIDTGVNEEDEDPWYTSIPNLVKPEERLPRQLKDNLGWEVEDVDTVILTHLHYDHTGYAYLFKNADFYVQREEYEYGINCVQEGFGLFYKKSNFDKNAIKYSSLRLLDGETQILPGIVCIPTRGHTVGHQSVLVDTAEGAICVTGDAVNAKLALDEEINAGPLVDGIAQKNAYKKIKQVAQMVCTAHDMDAEDVYDHQTSGFPKIQA